MQSLVPLSRGLVLALVSLMIAACASSTPSGTLHAEQRIICRSDVNTGSRLPNKTCRSKQEWDRISEETGELARNLERSTREGTISSGGRQ
ncbi:MAG: hypothetical protein OEU60_11645 [Gammaproteobacteria bacterium]|nr:hypothetical protein [Gammaproteobacteria bacterium]